jgi:hypothetical protein
MIDEGRRDTILEVIPALNDASDVLTAIAAVSRLFRDKSSEIADGLAGRFQRTELVP